MTRLSLVLAAGLVTAAAVLTAQAPAGVDPSTFSRPATTNWPTYNGDYSGRRFSTLTQVNATTVKNLSLAWMYRTSAGGAVKGTPLQVNGVIYLTNPDHVWALDARTGRELWHFAWQSKGGIHIGNRGAAISGVWLYI
jgi:alcohol dehydrogenase (cytochrome c)